MFWMRESNVQKPKSSCSLKRSLITVVSQEIAFYKILNRLPTSGNLSRNLRENRIKFSSNKNYFNLFDCLMYYGGISLKLKKCSV